MKDQDVSLTSNQKEKRNSEVGAQMKNEDLQDQTIDDDITVFKLNLTELLQTIEETQVYGDVLKDLIENFIQSLPSNNLEDFLKAVEIILEKKPQYSKILNNVTTAFKAYQKNQSQPDSKIDDPDDFFKIEDRKLCQIKIQVEEILDNWINNPEGSKQAADSLMVDEKELRYVLSKMITNLDMKDSARVEALTSLNLYVQEKHQAPIKMRLEEESLLIDNELLAEFKIEIEKILELWQLSPTHAKKAIEALIQRNEEVFREALLKINDEKKKDISKSLADLNLYLESKKQDNLTDKNSVLEFDQEQPEEKKRFFSRWFGN
jgi:hypothetical protein